MLQYDERQSTSLARYALAMIFTDYLLGAMYICIVAQAMGLTREKDGLSVSPTLIQWKGLWSLCLPLMAASEVRQAADDHFQ
jgi:hypothetical protein